MQYTHAKRSRTVKFFQHYDDFFLMVIVAELKNNCGWKYFIARLEGKSGILATKHFFFIIARLKHEGSKSGASG